MGFKRYLIFIVLIFLTGCKDRTAPASENEASGNEYSRRFIIEKFEAYSKLTVKDPWQGAVNRDFIYYISNDISKIPPGVDRSKIILRPVKNIVCTSTTHISMIDTLGGLELISGVSGSDFVYNRKIRKRINDEAVYDIGYENGYNTELIYSISPDLVLVYGVGSESASSFRRLMNMGIPVLYIADYLEQHPLARAEWIKVYGELLGRQEQAVKIFSSVRDKYEEVKQISSGQPGSDNRVMLGLPFKDKWFVSPGNSYISKLIEDAGGTYLWASTESDVSIPMSLEAVCQKALDADIWLNTGIALSVDDIRAVDARLAGLPVISEGLVYNNNKRLNSYGGNDYWESGTVNPHILLKDIASIINPDLFPEHELVYYKKILSSADTLK